MREYTEVQLTKQSIKGIPRHIICIANLGAEDFTREENLAASDASLKADYVESL
jgi:hypothetical protein